MPPRKLIAIVGPHASGKSSYAVDLAELFHGQVVSADSRQVYRHMDLGTGKITPDEMRGIPHHLIDIIDPGKRYSLFDFQRDAYSAIASIHGGHRQPVDEPEESTDEPGEPNRRGLACAAPLPIIAGGTGLYVAAVTEGYRLLDIKPDPALRRELERRSMEELQEIIRREQPGALGHIENRTKRRLIRVIEVIRAGFDYRETQKKNTKFDTLVIGIQWERDALRRRIKKRLQTRLAGGMIEEVKKLRAMGVPDGFLFDMGLEYRATLQYLQGGYDSWQDYAERLEIALGQFAKRQMTWFRGRSGITWIRHEDLMAPSALDDIRSFLEE